MYKRQVREMLKTDDLPKKNGRLGKKVNYENKIKSVLNALKDVESNGIMFNKKKLSVTILFFDWLI